MKIRKCVKILVTIHFVPYYSFHYISSHSFGPTFTLSRSFRPLSFRPLPVRPLSVRPLSFRPLSVRPLSFRPLSIRPTLILPHILWPSTVITMLRLL